MDLLKFFFKPQVKSVANRYLQEIRTGESDYEIRFAAVPQILYWPKACALDGIYQVTAETFDKEDWHYYQKAHTEIEQGEVLLDIGAAEGLFALSVADKCKKIYMVEPNDFFAESLKKTFQPFSDKAEIYNVAVGSYEGNIFFNNNSLSGKVSNDEHETGAHKKRITTIDTLFGDKTVTYFKADLEGFELEMLKAAEQVIRKNKPKIAITTYHPENDPKTIIEIIKKYVPEYNYYTKGIIHTAPKPVMIHFWI